MIKKITKISTIITVITLISIYSSTAIASSGEGFTIMSANPNNENPRKFSFEVMPGTKIEDFVEIQNISDKEESFLLYGADPTFSAQGTPAYKTRQASGNGEGKWISFEEEEITMSPNEKRIVKFTLEIPQKISEGDYRAGITMEKTPKSSGQEGISITTRVILHAEIKVTNTLSSSQISNESTNKSTGTKNQINWKEIYFWVSLTLFISSLIALLWITLANDKSKSTNNKSKLSENKTEQNKAKSNKSKKPTKNTSQTITKKKPIKTVKKTTKPNSSPKKITKKSTSTKKTKKK